MYGYEMQSLWGGNGPKKIPSVGCIFATASFGHAHWVCWRWYKKARNSWNMLRHMGKKVVQAVCILDSPVVSTEHFNQGNFHLALIFFCMCGVKRGPLLGQLMETMIMLVRRSKAMEASPYCYTTWLSNQLGRRMAELGATVEVKWPPIHLQKKFLFKVFLGFTCGAPGRWHVAVESLG